MDTKQLLVRYYAGIARKDGWEAVLSEDFKFTGGDMTKQEPLVGKAAYRGVIARFSRVYQTVRVAEMIVEGNAAFVRAHYDYVFPGDNRISGDVAEWWKVKNQLLDELTIFFDTLTFEKLTRRP